MKTQIEVDGKVFKVGDVITHVCGLSHDRTVLYIGESRVFYSDINGEGSMSYEYLKEWKVKPKMKTIKVDTWLNIHEYGVCSFNSKDEADAWDRLACEHFVRTYEVEDK